MIWMQVLRSQTLKILTVKCDLICPKFQGELSNENEEISKPVDISCAIINLKLKFYPLKGH